MSLIDLEKDPRLFLYTSLTAGSSHIVTATSRLETILKAHKIPYQAIDMATDEQARRLWQRRSKGRKLPGLVKAGFVLGDLNEIEDWNEFGELKQNIGPVPAANAPIPKGGQVGVQTAPPSAFAASSSTPATSAAAKTAGTSQGFDKSKGIALPGAEEIKARSLAKTAAAATAAAATAPPAEKIEVQKPAEDLKAEGEVEKAVSESTKVEGDSTKLEGENTKPGSEITKVECDSPKTESDSPNIKVNSTSIESENTKPEIESTKVEVETSQPSKGAAGHVENAVEDATGSETTKAEIEDEDDGNEESSTSKEQTTTVAATEKVEHAPVSTKKHRGSEVVAAPADMIKQVESQNALVEVDDEEGEAGLAKGVDNLRVVDAADGGEAVPHEKTQDQGAKEPDDAGKSVED